MTRVNGNKAPDPLDDLEGVIRELEGSEWEETSEVTNVTNHIHTAPGTTIEADGTGRLKAISIPDTENTKPDHPKPSEAPKSGLPGILVIAFQGVSRINSWPAAIVAVALVALSALWVWLTKR